MKISKSLMNSVIRSNVFTSGREIRERPRFQKMREVRRRLYVSWRQRKQSLYWEWRVSSYWREAKPRSETEALLEDIFELE